MQQRRKQQSATAIRPPPIGRAGPAAAIHPHRPRNNPAGTRARQVRRFPERVRCRKAGPRRLQLQPERQIPHRRAAGAHLHHPPILLHQRRLRGPGRLPAGAVPRRQWQKPRLQDGVWRPIRQRLPHLQAGARQHRPPTRHPRQRQAGACPPPHRLSPRRNGRARPRRRLHLRPTTCGASSRSPTWLTGRVAALVQAHRRLRCSRRPRHQHRHRHPQQPHRSHSILLPRRRPPPSRPRKAGGLPHSPSRPASTLSECWQARRRRLAWPAICCAALWLAWW